MKNYLFESENPEKGTLLSNYGLSGHDITLRFTPINERMLADLGTLSIKTGADEITWGYGLNTKRYPTYGGEVIQILSTFADKMIIKGTCRNYRELENIYEYFRNYIFYTTGGAKNITGSNQDALRRMQKYLLFEYPARNWKFVIMVADASGFRISRDVAAPEWQITAEIVSENARYRLGSERLDRFASVLQTPAVKATGRRTRSAPTQGFLQPAPRSGDAASEEEEVAPVVPKNFVIERAGDPFRTFMETTGGERGKIADNFHALIASWATGDISTIPNNPIAEPEKREMEIWESKFGEGATLSGVGGGNDGNTIDTESGSSISGVLDPVYVAALASIGFEKEGLTSQAQDEETLVEAVKVAYGESNWNTQAVGYNGAGKEATYESFVTKHASEPPTSNDDSWDIGLWQINNYWHPTDILNVTGLETANGDYPTERKRAASNKAYIKLLDDPIVNARAMALSYKGRDNTWGAWVAHGGDAYNKADAPARRAVKKFLLDPEKYKNEVLNGGLGANVPMTKSRSEALTKIKDLIDKGVISSEGLHPNDKAGLLSAKGIISGHRGAHGGKYDNDKVVISTNILKCIANLGQYALSKDWTFAVSSIVGSHSRCVEGDDFEGCRESRHWTGFGLDIYMINGNPLETKKAKSNTITFMKLLNSMTPKPNQIIMYGNGEADPDVNKYELNGTIKGPSGYDSGTHGNHMNHIHIGY